MGQSDMEVSALFTSVYGGRIARINFLQIAHHEKFAKYCSSVFTARYTLVQSAVLRSHLVCLSVSNVCL